MTDGYFEVVEFLNRDCDELFEHMVRAFENDPEFEAAIVPEKQEPAFK